MMRNSTKEAHSSIVILHCNFQDDVPKEVSLNSQGKLTLITLLFRQLGLNYFSPQNILGGNVGSSCARKTFQWPFSSPNEFIKPSKEHIQGRRLLSKKKT
jgi:hypothetical protein